MKKMINTALWIFVAIVGIIVITRINDRDTMVTRPEFTQAHQILNARIDSILHQCDTMRTDLRSLRADADTLKAGQRAIFETMQENQGTTLGGFLQNLFNNL